MSEEELRKLWENKKYNTICIIRIPEREENQGRENKFEKIMMEIFSNFMREKFTLV